MTSVAINIVSMCPRELVLFSVKQNPKSGIARSQGCVLWGRFKRQSVIPNIGKECLFPVTVAFGTQSIGMSFLLMVLTCQTYIALGLF